MMYLLDSAALNSFILFLKKNGLEDARQRRISLENLARDLIRQCTARRIEILSRNNFSGIQASLFSAFNKLKFNIRRVREESNNSNSTVESTYKRCSSNECKEKNNNNKYRRICKDCGFNFCPNHSEKITTILCNECIYD